MLKEKQELTCFASYKILELEKLRLKTRLTDKNFLQKKIRIMKRLKE